jgi:transposase
MRELYYPTDGAKPLTGREIAEKFEVGIHVVYNAVHMTPAQIMAFMEAENRKR